MLERFLSGKNLLTYLYLKDKFLVPIVMAAGFLLMAAVILLFEIWFRTEDNFKSLGYYRAEIYMQLQ